MEYFLVVKSPRSVAPRAVPWNAILLCLCALALAHPAGIFAVGTKRPLGLSIQKHNVKDGEVGYRNYLLFIPAQYNQSRTRKWPLIMFLHGSEQRGSDPMLVAREGLPAVLAKNTDFPFIVVSPQCPPEMKWSPPAVMSLLSSVEKKLRVDTRRVYLTGFSMGGYGTWRTAVAYPQVFAAIAPLCGGGDPSSAARLRSVPVWAFHGALDENVPVSESKVMVEAVREGGGSARLTIYPDLDHDCWTKTYKDGRLYTWLLSQRKAGG